MLKEVEKRMKDTLIVLGMDRAMLVAEQNRHLTDDEFTTLLADIGSNFAELQAGRLDADYLSKVVGAFVTAAWTARSSIGRQALN